MSRQAIEDRRQRAREAVQDAMAPDLFNYEQKQIITAAEIGIEAATRVKITEEAIEAFDNDRNGSESAGNIRAGLTAALAELGFEVEN